MNIKLLTILSILLLSGTAVAQTFDVTLVAQTWNTNLDKVPDFVKAVIGNENMHIYFTDNTGTVQEYAAITKDAKITEAAAWVDNDNNDNHDNWDDNNIHPTLALRFSQSTLENIAYSQDPLATLQKAWGTEIKFEAIDWGANFKIMFMNVGMWFAGFFGGGQPTAPVTNQAAGAICDNGGECESGYCLYHSGEGANRIYKCSCDQLTLTIQDPCPTNPYQPEQGNGKQVGETCNHGGECVTGNCVGTGQGPPWVYKCSCDPQKYDAYSC